MTIYVGNLSYSVEAKQLQSLFESYGAVSKVSLPMDRETGRPRGFAFVDMENAADEDAAVAGLNGTELLDRTLRVNKAEPKENSGSRSGSSRPAFNNRNTSGDRGGAGAGAGRGGERSSFRGSDSYTNDRGGERRSNNNRNKRYDD
ncbi:MAG: RNA-binding protein [Thiofilum sp.]|uniref:RNA recognition motif domain-containing protein n=1 Tax=Thiofilum sp. TaxID=2212733 RepID=UPI0025E8BBFD|nr:RNA-binding protein [Thiofilum sp.]MBK8454970.1 RNA-binding protein [Thiofilum sp.]